MTTSSDENPSSPDDTTATPRKGGTFRIGLAKLTSLDPSQARTVEQSQVADLLFDSLTTYDPKTLEAVPSLAERWEASPDQKTWTFHLRPGATFANGRAISAADVKYSLERVVKKGSGANSADLLENVTGYFALAVEGSTEDLSGVGAPAADVVTFALDSPQSLLPSVLANPGFGVVPREELARPEGQPTFAEQPTASGPFKYARAANGVVTLARRAEAEAFVDKVELVQFDDVAGAYSAFGKGEVDWSRVPPDDVGDAAGKYGRKHYTAYLAELFFGFNLKSPAFANQKFRAAVIAAVDRAAIVEAVYDSTVTKLEGIVVPSLRQDREDLCAGACKYDPSRAKQLLTEAFGEGAPPDVNIDYDQDTTYDAVAKAIQANLRAVGIPATLRPRGLAEYRDFVVSGNQQLFRFGWIAPYPSPDGFLYPLFFSGSRSNLVGLTSAAVDDQLRAARASADPAARTAAWVAAERAILAETPVLPLAQFQIHAVAGTRVRGLNTLPTGTFDTTKVWLTGS